MPSDRHDCGSTGGRKCGVIRGKILEVDVENDEKMTECSRTAVMLDGKMSNFLC